MFRKYWFDCPFDVYINAEKKEYNEHGIKTLHTYGAWTDRLSDALKQIETPFVICCLEDFFLRDYVKTEEILNGIDILKKHDDIACMYYKRIRGFQYSEIVFDNFMEMIPDSKASNEYLLNCQVGLWRKEILELVLSRVKEGTAWDFEIEGYKKNKDVIDKNKFYCTIKSHCEALEEDEIFPYNVSRTIGTGIYKSRWLWNNKKFFKEQGIIVKYNKLKKMSKIEFYYIEYWKPYLNRIVSAVERRLHRKRY